MSGPAAGKKMDELLSATETREESFVDGGEFLPLNVWAVKGYDPDVIKAKTVPADVREDLVVGTTYRLRVLRTNNRGLKTTVRSSTVKGNQVLHQSPGGSSGDAMVPRLALTDGAVGEGTASPAVLPP